MSQANKPQLYSGQRQFENFCRMNDFYPSVSFSKSHKPFSFDVGQVIDLPEIFRFKGETRRTDDLINETDTSAILILQHGQIRHESYFLTGGADVPWTSWSVAKSFISALVGIALEEGHIKSIDDAISDYVPALVGSGYEGVSIQHVLQMSSGALWNEDYSDAKSSVNQLGSVMIGEATLDDFVARIEAERAAGTFCQYNSADTQALGMLLRGATGRSVTDYMTEKLVEPLGFEHPGFWIADKENTELVLGGLNLTARDFAKIGELYRNQGWWQGEQLVPEAWVAASTQCSAPHLQPGQVVVGGHHFAFGYGYQWWIPKGDRGAYSAIGVYNQFVYVDPPTGSVIVKLSANPRYGLSGEDADNREEETVAMIDAIVAQLEN